MQNKKKKKEKKVKGRTIQEKFAEIKIDYMTCRPPLLSLLPFIPILTPRVTS